MSDDRRLSAAPDRTVPWTVALDVRAVGGAVDPSAAGGAWDDLQLAGAAPEVVAAAAQRLEKFDAAVCEALHDAPVPDDLEARLFAVLAAEQAAGGLAGGPAAEAISRARSDEADSPPLLSPPKRLPLGQRWARRPWLVRLSWATAAALVLGFVGFTLRPPHVPRTAAALEAAVRELHAQARPAAPSELRLWPDYPLSRFVRPRLAVASESLPALDGLAAAAYRLRSARGTQATLYVLKCPPQPTAAAWAAVPNRRPLYTQGMASSVWREDERLYVLVVEGDERDYLEFLRFPDAAVG